jgi:hypothetical protein
MAPAKSRDLGAEIAFLSRALKAPALRDSAKRPRPTLPNARAADCPGSGQQPARVLAP